MIRRLLLATVLVMIPAAMHAQTYARQVWDQLQAAYDTATDTAGFNLQNYILGKLDDNQKDSWTFTLERGREYMVIGACDTDCSDMDLFVKDSRGTVVVKDDSIDDNPVTRFRVNTTGRFTLEVEMYACSDNPCYFGFGLFYK